MDPFFIGIATGAIALLASLASLLLGLKNHALAQRKLSLDEETRQAEARRLTDKFRNPLVSSAHELASRLYNIINLDFFIWATRGPCERAYVETHTMYVFAQFLGWMELLSQEVQFLDLGSAERSKKLNALLYDVRSTLRASHLGDEHTFRLFQGQQRAIGEAMIVDRGPGGRTVMGYKAFCEAYWDKRNPTLAFWLHPLAESCRRIIEAYDCPKEVCTNREDRLLLFLELEMRFVRLDMLWQSLSALIRHLDPECAYHDTEQLIKPPNQWALVARRRGELELKMREDPAWPAGSPWTNSRLLEACRAGKAADWLKKTIQAEWQRCPRTLMPVKKHVMAQVTHQGYPLLLQLEDAETVTATVEEAQGKDVESGFPGSKGRGDGKGEPAKGGDGKGGEGNGKGEPGKERGGGKGEGGKGGKGEKGDGKDGGKGKKGGGDKLDFGGGKGMGFKVPHAKVFYGRGGDGDDGGGGGRGRHGGAGAQEEEQQRHYGPGGGGLEGQAGWPHPGDQEGGHPQHPPPYQQQQQPQEHAWQPDQQGGWGMQDAYSRLHAPDRHMPTVEPASGDAVLMVGPDAGR